jgi:hypothetical protein
VTVPTSLPSAVFTSAVAGGVAVADFLEAAAPSLARCAILTGARSELGGLLFSIVDFSENCRDGISFATADVATSSRPDAAMAMKWYMIATSYLQKEACKIAAWRVRRKPLRSNSLESMITFRASVCRATASARNSHRGAASGWHLVSHDGDPHVEIAAATIDKKWRRASCCGSLCEFLKDTASPL